MPPKFIQLYIYDTANEIRNRLHALDPNEAPADPLDAEVIENLIQMLDNHNPFAREFRLARDRLRDHGSKEFTIRIIGAREGDPVQYNLPTTDQLAMLIVGDFTLDTFKRDIVIETHSGQLHQISALHPAFMALQYPLLFPYGERGFQIGIPYNDTNPVQGTARAKVTMQDYYRYMFHYKKKSAKSLLMLRFFIKPGQG
jgi:hypothetical protein